MTTIRTFTTCDTLGATDPEIIMTASLWVYKATFLVPAWYGKAATILAIIF